MTDADTKSVRIDRLSIWEARAAVDAPSGAIRCPNGCHEPFPLTANYLRGVALQHARCKVCAEFHLVEWRGEDSVDA